MRPVAILSKENIMTLQTRNARVKVPNKSRFHKRVSLVTPNNDMTTSNPSGTVYIDQTPLKKSQKLLSCTETSSLTTFNACTLTKQISISEFINSVNRHLLDLVCVQEHRILHDEPIKHHKISADLTFKTSSATINNANSAVGGVGILVNQHILKSLISVESISSRIMIATFSGNSETTVLCCYSPHNQFPEDAVIKFYQNLSDVIRHVPAHNVLFICGDFNAQIGLDKVKHSYHKSTNRNGKYIFDFTESFDLLSTNNRFQKPPRKLWTCQYPNGSRGQVYYIIIRRKWARSVSNVETYSSTFDSLDSDHKALSSQIKLRLRAPKKKNCDFRTINFRSLSESKELHDLYTLNVYNRFSELVNDIQDTTNPQENYGCLVRSCTEIGKTHLPKKDQKKLSNLHLSERVFQSRDRLRKALDSRDRRAINAAKEDLQQAYTSAEECLISTQVHIIEQSSFSGKRAAV